MSVWFLCSGSINSGQFHQGFHSLVVSVANTTDYWHMAGRKKRNRYLWSKNKTTAQFITRPSVWSHPLRAAAAKVRGNHTPPRPFQPSVVLYSDLYFSPSLSTLPSKINSQTQKATFYSRARLWQFTLLHDWSWQSVLPLVKTRDWEHAGVHTCRLFSESGHTCDFNSCEIMWKSTYVLIAVNELIASAGFNRSNK